MVKWSELYLKQSSEANKHQTWYLQRLLNVLLNMHHNMLWNNLSFISYQCDLATRCNISHKVCTRFCCASHCFSYVIILRGFVWHTYPSPTGVSTTGTIHPSTKSPLAGAARNFSLSQARQLCNVGLSVANLRQAAGNFKGNVVRSCIWNRSDGCMLGVTRINQTIGTF